MLTLGFVTMLVDSPSGEEPKPVEQDPYLILAASPTRTKPVDSPNKTASDDAVSQLNKLFALTHSHILIKLFFSSFLFASSITCTLSTLFPIRL